MFIATGYVGERREFWWDELARIILECDSAIDGEISVAGERRHVRRTERERTYMQVWKLLQPLTGVEREAALSMLHATSRSGPADPEDLPMTAEEIRDLTRGGLIKRSNVGLLLSFG